MANFLGTLAGLVVGLPIVAATAYLILSRFGSVPLGRAAPPERLVDTADGGDPALAIDESAADPPPELHEDRRETVVADFADDRVPFRIAGQTYDQEQKEKEGRVLQQNQEILQQIFEESVALCTEISGRRRVG
ncbi:MAG: hypothetical protein ACYTG0_26435 [Planctomycetota bacterium]|jgi:hypothetical protein